MKRLIALISSLTLISTTGFSVVACSENNDGLNTISKLKKDIAERNWYVWAINKELIELNEKQEDIMNRSDLSNQEKEKRWKELQNRKDELRKSLEVIQKEIENLYRDWAIFVLQNNKIEYNFNSNYQDDKLIKDMFLDSVIKVFINEKMRDYDFEYNSSGIDFKYFYRMSNNKYGIYYGYNFGTNNDYQYITSIFYING